MKSYEPVESSCTPGHWYVNETVDGFTATVCIFIGHDHPLNMQRAIDYAEAMNEAAQLCNT